MQIKSRSLTFEGLEARQLFAVSAGWDGPGLGTAQLTYFVGKVPSTFSLTTAQVESAIDTALKTWAAVADIDFVKTAQPGRSRSLDFTFRSLDGVGGTLAQAYFPADVNPAALAGDVQFDMAESFEVGNGRGAAATDFLWVAVHEIGHALGLDHNEVKGSVLAPAVSPDQYFVSLGSQEIRDIRSLYASTPGSVMNGGPTVPTSPKTPVAPEKPNTPRDPGGSGSGPTATENPGTSCPNPRGGNDAPSEGRMRNRGWENSSWGNSNELGRSFSRFFDAWFRSVARNNARSFFRSSR